MPLAHCIIVCTLHVINFVSLFVHPELISRIQFFVRFDGEIRDRALPSEISTR